MRKVLAVLMAVVVCASVAFAAEPSGVAAPLQPVAISATPPAAPSPGTTAKVELPRAIVVAVQNLHADAVITDIQKNDKTGDLTFTATYKTDGKQTATTIVTSTTKVTPPDAIAKAMQAKYTDLTNAIVTSLREGDKLTYYCYSLPVPGSGASKATTTYMLAQLDDKGTALLKDITPAATKTEANDTKPASTPATPTTPAASLPKTNDVVASATLAPVQNK